MEVRSADGVLRQHDILISRFIKILPIGSCYKLQWVYLARSLFPSYPKFVARKYASD